MGKRGRPRKPRPEEAVRKEIERMYNEKIENLARQRDAYADACKTLEARLDFLNKRCDELLEEIQSGEDKQDMLREIIIDAIRGVYS